ncbi:hypothetical protein V8B97DRAFT_1919290 [Scleroderma yunnanense]
MMMLVRHLLHLQCLLCLLQTETDLVDEKLLSWLWDNPADHAVLFNEKKDTNTQGTSAKPHGWCKKDISTVITHIVFHNDVVYGEIYAKSAEYQWWQAALQCRQNINIMHYVSDPLKKGLIPMIQTIRPFKWASAINMINMMIQWANTAETFHWAGLCNWRKKNQNTMMWSMMQRCLGVFKIGRMGHQLQASFQSTSHPLMTELNLGIMDQLHRSPMSTLTTSFSTPLSGNFSPDMTSKTSHMVFKGKGKSGFTSIKASLDDKLVEYSQE